MNSTVEEKWGRVPFAKSIKTAYTRTKYRGIVVLKEARLRILTPLESHKSSDTIRTFWAG